MAQTIYGMGVIVGPTLGPPLGGYVDRFSWPYIFTSIFLGIIATLLTLSFVRSPKYGEKLKSNQVDWLGIILWHLSSAPYNSY
jgi:DHA2 family multidrug resistance protein